MNDFVEMQDLKARVANLENVIHQNILPALKTQGQINEALKGMIMEAKKGTAAVSKDIASPTLTPSEFGDPEEGETFWYIDSDNDLCDDYTFDSDDRDYGPKQLEIGNCFKTKHQAERHLKKLKMLRRMAEIAEFFKPDFAGGEQYFVIQWEDGDWKIEDYVEFQYAGMNQYFKTLEQAEKALEELGEQLNLFLE